jgi:RNA polymerase sigma-70 factor (ECF subfamily)
MEGLSDEQLITSLHQGQTAALDELYKRYARKLYVFCDHSLVFRDAHQAEDLVQEVFIRVIKAAHTFDPQKASFRTWLFRIARNCCIDTNRKERRFAFLNSRLQPGFNAPEEQLPRDEVLRTHEGDIESQMIDAALHQAVSDCIQALENEEERQAILLYYLAGKVYREIAEILGKSLSTAKNRVHTARDKVKTCLSKKGFL